MLLEFKVYRIKKESSLWKMVEKYNHPNEFIVIGENENCYLCHQLKEEGLRLIAGLNLEQLAYQVPKDDLTLQNSGPGYLTTDLDIPKKYLTIDMIENIKRLNE
jgi:hypothetical protein